MEDCNFSMQKNKHGCVGSDAAQAGGKIKLNAPPAGRVANPIRIVSVVLNLGHGTISRRIHRLNHDMQRENRKILYFKLQLCNGFRNGYNVRRLLWDDRTFEQLLRQYYA
jgi:hypothetical protein